MTASGRLQPDRTGSKRPEAAFHHVIPLHSHHSVECIGFDLMVGHVLSATTVKECLREPEPIPYFIPLQKFVMGDDTATDDTHDFYAWFYPHRRHMSIKMFACRNQGHLATLSLLSFFPLAFLITEKGQGIYPSGATPMKPTDKTLHVKLDSGHLPYAAFPNAGLEGDQMILLHGSQAIVSYPI